jgi:hypothetical protein
MKATRFIVQVVVLWAVLVCIGTLSLLALGDMVFGSCGRNPLVLGRQLLTSGIMVCTAVLLCSFSRFTRTELLTSAGVAQAVLALVAGWTWDAQIAWQLSWCTGLSFAVSLCLSIAAQKMTKWGQQGAASLPPAPQTGPSEDAR